MARIEQCDSIAAQVCDGLCRLATTDMVSCVQLNIWNMAVDSCRASSSLQSGLARGACCMHASNFLLTIEQNAHRTHINLRIFCIKFCFAAVKKSKIISSRRELKPNDKHSKPFQTKRGDTFVAHGFGVMCAYSPTVWRRAFALRH